jgi:hypothetical protein
MLQTPVTTLLMKTTLTPLRGTSDHPHFNVLTPAVANNEDTELQKRVTVFVCKYFPSVSWLYNVHTLTALLYLKLSNKVYVRVYCVRK